VHPALRKALAAQLQEEFRRSADLYRLAKESRTRRTRKPLRGFLRREVRGKYRTVRPTHAAAQLEWWPLAVIASAHLVAVLDTTIMFVALPSIQRGLHMSPSSRQWVVTAYTLALAGLLLLGGRLADRFGARRTLLVGVVGFACASGVGGASVDGTMLIAARAVQGAFGAVLVSSTRSLLVTVYHEEHQRAKVLGVFTATLTAGPGRRDSCSAG
jgi:hypothetical protein